LAINIYGITYGIKNADGILLGGSYMVHVSKDLSPDPLATGIGITVNGSGVKLRGA